MKFRFVCMLAVSATALSVSLLTGCGHNKAGSGGGTKIVYSTDHSTLPPSTPGKYGGNLTFCQPGDPKTFNFWVNTDQSSTDVTSPTVDVLEQRNPFTLKFEPRLAESLPTVSPDGLTYTFTLRKGLQWSDGQPLTADDVIWTLEMLFDPKTQGLTREGMFVDVPQPNGTVKHIPFAYKKTGPLTVQFTLPAKYAPALDMFSFPVAPKHALEAAYKAGQINSTWGTNADPKTFVSCGAFVIDQYVPGQRIVYKPNPHFWKKDAQGRQLPYLSTYTYLIVQDFNTTTLKFHSGESDILEVRLENYPNEKKKEDAEGYTLVDRGPEWGFNYLCFNQNPHSKLDPALVKLFSTQKFRQAVSYAVNRDRICNDICLGLAKPQWGTDSPANVDFYDPNVTQYPYSLDKAKALLAEMGLKDTDGDGILNLPGGGKNISFNIITNVENEQRKNTATIIADDLKKVGLNSTFTPVAFNDLIRRVEDPPFDWQAVIGGFVGVPEPHSGVNIWRSDGTDHTWWPKQKTPATPWEAQIDKLMLQGDHELDLNKRKVIYAQIQQILSEQQAYIPTIVREQFTAVRNHFGNIKPSTLYGVNGGVLWNVEEIYDTNATGTAPGAS